MTMNKKAKDNLKFNEKQIIRMEIASKYQMVKHIRGYAFFMLIVFVLGSLCAWWGFSSITERPLANISFSSHVTIAWVAVALAFIGLLSSSFLFYVLGNAGKHIVRLIDIYDEKYPETRYQLDQEETESAD